jgi:5-dehydro-2-deoxygluconokinase
MVSDATLVCKRGARGAVAFEGAIPASLDDGQTGPGFPIEVFNVLGAGDGFFSGLLKGWLTGQDWPTSLHSQRLRRLQASPRHGCTPAYPRSADRLFLGRGIVRPDLRNDPALEQVHWATNRQREHGGDFGDAGLAFDHRCSSRR